MAYTNNGTDVNISSQIIPGSFTPPPVTPFDNSGLAAYDRTFTIDKSTVENADASTTLLAIVTAIEGLVNSLVQDEFEQTDKDVTVYSDFYNMGTNVSPTGSNALLTNVVVKYICKVKIYVKSEDSA